MHFLLLLEFGARRRRLTGAAQNTNVVKFFSMLRKDIDHEQLCYYQTGIGTYVNPGIITPIMTYVAKLMDKAIAW